MSRAIKTVERVIPSYVEFEGMNFPQVLDLQAKRRPDKVLFVHGEERVTFKEFSEQTDNLAAALKRHGLRRGEPCGLVYPNGLRYLLLKFAILKVGAILIPLNTRYRSSELNFMLDFSDARFLFMVKGFLKADFTEILREIRPNLPKLEKIYVDGEGIPEGMLDIDRALSVPGHGEREGGDTVGSDQPQGACHPPLYFRHNGTAQGGRHVP